MRPCQFPSASTTGEPIKATTVPVNEGGFVQKIKGFFGNLFGGGAKLDKQKLAGEKMQTEDQIHSIILTGLMLCFLFSTRGIGALVVRVGVECFPPHLSHYCLVCAWEKNRCVCTISMCACTAEHSCS